MPENLDSPPVSAADVHLLTAPAEFTSGAFMTVARHELDPCEHEVLPAGHTYWSGAEFLGERFYLVVTANEAGPSQHFLTTRLSEALQRASAASPTPVKLFAFIASRREQCRPDVLGEVDEVRWCGSEDRFVICFRNGAPLMVDGDESRFLNQPVTDLAVAYPRAKVASLATLPVTAHALTVKEL